MRKGWFWLSLVCLASGLGYILTAHPSLFSTVSVLVLALTLCGASWVMS